MLIAPYLDGIFQIGRRHEIQQVFLRTPVYMNFFNFKNSGCYKRFSCSRQFLDPGWKHGVLLDNTYILAEFGTSNLIFGEIMDFYMKSPDFWVLQKWELRENFFSVRIDGLGTLFNKNG